MLGLIPQGRLSAAGGAEPGRWRAPPTRPAGTRCRAPVPWPRCGRSASPSAGTLPAAVYRSLGCAEGERVPAVLPAAGLGDRQPGQPRPPVPATGHAGACACWPWTTGWRRSTLPGRGRGRRRRATLARGPRRRAGHQAAAIGVAGDSAGGNLAAVLALMARRQRARAGHQACSTGHRSGRHRLVCPRHADVPADRGDHAHVHRPLRRRCAARRLARLALRRAFRRLRPALVLTVACPFVRRRFGLCQRPRATGVRRGPAAPE